MLSRRRSLALITPTGSRVGGRCEVSSTRPHRLRKVTAPACMRAMALVPKLPCSWWRATAIRLVRRHFKAAEPHEVCARHKQARATDVVDRAYKGELGRVRPGTAAVAQCRAAGAILRDDLAADRAGARVGTDRPVSGHQLIEALYEARHQLYVVVQKE
eukprot:scaffold52458_cov69-Phaeocystis_antarctica.AAC.4